MNNIETPKIILQNHDIKIEQQTDHTQNLKTTQTNKSPIETNPQEKIKQRKKESSLYI